MTYTINLSNNTQVTFDETIINNKATCTIHITSDNNKLTTLIIPHEPASLLAQSLQNCINNLTTFKHTTPRLIKEIFNLYADKKWLSTQPIHTLHTDDTFPNHIPGPRSIPRSITTDQNPSHRENEKKTIQQWLQNKK